MSRFQQAPLAEEPPELFRDVTMEMLPPQWKAIGHSGDPRQLAFMGAAFVDLNGDGILDIVNPNHYSTCDVTDDNKRCKGAFNWDVGFLSEPPSPGAMSPIRPAPEGFMLVEDDIEADRIGYLAQLEAGKNAEEDHTLAKPWNADVHGFTVVDLDNDGHKDFYAGIGVNRGLDKSTSSRNMLLWGQQEGGMRGGRTAATEAGLSGLFGRSRGVTVFDANHDGILDVYLSHEARVDDLVVPSALLISKSRPKRTWALAKGNREVDGSGGPVAVYTGKAVLIDVDMNGHVAELVTLVLNCTPEAQTEPTAPTTLASKFAVPESPREFCNHRPQASTLSAMWFDGSDGVQVRNFKYDELYGITDAARLCGADIDGDGFADLAILSRGHIFAFFSRNARPGETLLSSPPKLVTVLPKGFTPSDFSFADFDLDGVLDMYVAGEKLGDGRLFKNRGYGVFDCCLDEIRGKKVQSGIPQSSFFSLQGANYVTSDKFIPVSEETRGLSVADFNNDGYPDIFLTHAKHAATLLLNRGADLFDEGRYVAFILKGLVANSEGIGAAVTLYTTLPVRSGSTQFMRMVGASQRSAGHDDRRLIFGLGGKANVDKVVVTWPSGYVQLVKGDELDNLEGNGTAGNPFIIKEKAIIAVSGRWGGCGEGDDATKDMIDVNIALATHIGELQENVNIARTRKALTKANRTGIPYAPVLVVQSTNKPLNHSVQVGAGAQRLGGILPAPPRAHAPGFGCSGGGEVFSHIRGGGNASYSVTKMDNMQMKPGWNRNAPYRSAHTIALERPKDGKQTFFQLVDTLTCALSPVFIAPEGRCE